MNTQSTRHDRGSHFIKGHGQQTGVVLIVGLVFLLLMTILGVTAIQNSTMQERMAMNASSRNEAFQAAEQALIVGETEVISSQCDGLTGQLDWPLDESEPSTWSPSTAVDTDFDSAYILSRIPQQQGDDESAAAEDSNQCGGYYYVFAKAESSKGMTVVLRSTVFKKY